MKKSSLTLLLVAVLLPLVSCKKDKSVEYITLSQLADKCGNSGNFEADVQNVYITAVGASYALIEDNTQAIKVNKSGLSLTAGRIVNGHITGSGRIVNGIFELSDLSVSGANVSDTDVLPSTDATVLEILADGSKYQNRRVKLTDVMFTDNNKGKVGDKGVIVQKGKAFPIEAANSKYYWIAGDQGDIYVYPCGGVGYVFDDKEFIEHEVKTPLSVQSTLGVYRIEGDSANPVYVYESGKDQQAFGKNETERFFRLQNYFEGFAASAVMNTDAIKECSMQRVTLSVPASVLSGGPVNEMSTITADMFLEKKVGGKLWLMDYESGLGIIINVEE